MQPSGGAAGPPAAYPGIHVDGEATTEKKVSLLN